MIGTHICSVCMRELSLSLFTVHCWWILSSAYLQRNHLATLTVAKKGESRQSRCVATCNMCFFLLWVCMLHIVTDCDLIVDMTTLVIRMKGNRLQTSITSGICVYICRILLLQAQSLWLWLNRLNCRYKCYKYKLFIKLDGFLQWGTIAIRSKTLKS